MPSNTRENSCYGRPKADETILPVQMYFKRGADHQAYLWQYRKPGGETVFDFQLGRGREGPRKFLGAWVDARVEAGLILLRRTRSHAALRGGWYLSQSGNLQAKCTQPFQRGLAFGKRLCS